MSFQEIMGELQPVLASLLIAVLTWGATELTRWIRSRIKDERVAKAVEDVSAVIVDTVKELEQKTRPMLRDGKLSADEKKEIFAQAKTLINSKVKPTAMSVLKGSVGDIETWIDGKIEASVYDMKKEASCIETKPSA